MTAILESPVERRRCAEPRSLLFVEDNEDDFVLARYELRKLKITNPVHRVSTVEQLLNYLGGYDEYADRAEYPLPAVIFLDLRLPDISGLNAQAIIRSNLKYRDIPIIIISSNERLNALRSAVTLGANAYMVKPFCGKQFARILLDQDFRLHIAAEF